MQLYYRGMAGKNGKPRIGQSARLLGVRPQVDIDIAQMPRGYLDAQGYLLPESERTDAGEIVDVVVKNHKGMSVSLSIEGLPPFRKPENFGGTGRDPLWQIPSERITGDLEALQDSATHVSLRPSTTMLLDRYEIALASTQDDWSKVTENGMGI